MSRGLLAVLFCAAVGCASPQEPESPAVVSIGSEQGDDGSEVKPSLVDECAEGAAECSPDAECIDTSDGYACKCKAGFAGDGKACDDIDECQASPCGEFATCTNTAGGYSCACLDGFAGDGVTCEDRDECAEGTAACGVNARCVNVPGTYTCECLSGFDGDGTTCERGIAVSIEGGREYARGVDVTVHIMPPENALQNPSSERGDLSGWTIGGCDGGLSVTSPGIFGAYAVVSSYCVVSRSQEVDLLALGYSEADLDGSRKPRVNAFSFYRGTGPVFEDSYRFTLELLGADRSVLTAYQGTRRDARIAVQYTDSWIANYPAGVRYVRFSETVFDAEYAEGSYGTVLDGAAVTLGERPEMRLSNDGVEWTAWREYVPAMPWTLAPGPGLKVVHIEVRTVGGDVYTGQDTIRLE